jgi:hypothetical protein
MAYRKFVLLMLMLIAALLRGTHEQESSSRSSRREASDESTTFVGFDDRGDAVRAICDKSVSRLFEEYLEDMSHWPDLESGLPENHPKPVISKSWAYITFARNNIMFNGVAILNYHIYTIYAYLTAKHH